MKDLIEMASASSDSVILDELKDLITYSMCTETLNEPRTGMDFHILIWGGGKIFGGVLFHQN